MFRTLRNYLKILFSGTFDSHYYLQQYRDVRQADVDPLWHFVKFGWREGRNPSGNFNTRFYLETNPDVKRSGMNPVIHYIHHGKAEGRLLVPALNQAQESNTSGGGSNFDLSVSSQGEGHDLHLPINKNVLCYDSVNTWLDEEALEVLSEISQ